MKFINVLLLMALCLSVFAQEPQVVHVPTATVPKVNPEFLNLNQDNIAIRKDSVLNEHIVDLVDVYEADSIIHKKRQHHHTGFGLIALFGYGWRAITMKRQKFVGTSIESQGANGEAQFTEYDIKYNMVAHIPRYAEMAYWGYQRMMQRNVRLGKDGQYTHATFNRPSPETYDKFRLHNELTPKNTYWHPLDSLFFPCVGGTSHEEHENFGENHVTLGMYGVFVNDCNHHCGPEMHPYEWIWWLEVNPKHDNRPDEKRWLVGLFRESSNRFRRWSKKPRRGVVSVPFIFPVDQADKTINVEHLVTSKLLLKGLGDLPTVPADAHQFDATDYTLQLDGLNTSINLTSNQTMPDGLRWWVTKVQSDGQYITGYLNIAVSMDYVWTARVTVE